MEGVEYQNTLENCEFYAEEAAKDSIYVHAEMQGLRLDLRKPKIETREIVSINQSHAFPIANHLAL